MLPIPEKARRSIEVSLVAAAILGLSYIGSTAKEGYETYKQTEVVASTWEKVRTNNSSLYPYQIEERRHPLDNTKSYWIRRLRKAEDEKNRLAIAEGLIPTFRLINKEGLDINFNRIEPDEIRKIFNENGFNISGSQAESLSLSNTATRKNLVLEEGKTIKKIVIFGDSWGVWGGNAYSIPNLLEMLLLLSGYDIQVLNASILGGNIYDLPEDIQTKISDPSTLFMPFIQPDTDFSSDLERISAPPEYQANALRYWFAENLKPDPKQIAKHELLKDARYTPLAEAMQIYWLASGKRDQHPVSKTVKDPDYAKPYFEGFKAIVKESNMTRPVLLPPVWMIKPFAEEDFPKFQQIVKERIPHTVFTHLDDLEEQLDEKVHPNPSGALEIAVQIFENLTGSTASKEVVQQVKEITELRIRTLEEIFAKSDPLFPDFTPLYPDLYPKN